MDWIKREEASGKLDSDCRIDMTCDGCHNFIRIHFGFSNTSWKAYQIYVPMDLESPPYLFGVNRNR
jgi:hypothetical protein